MSQPDNYLHGFANEFETEALEGALPIGQNSPQKPAYGLYAEQLSGSAFTTPRHQTLRSWLYRIRPSVVHGEFKAYKHNKNCLTPEHCMTDAPPNQMRWSPIPIPSRATHFIDGLFTMAGNGSLHGHAGAAIHHYAINASMEAEYFYNADGDMLVVPEHGELWFATEMGNLAVVPGEILLIPRGVKFQVILQAQTARGYVCENFGAPFVLPELGPIGANGLANPRDFQYPVAHYTDVVGDFTLLCKSDGLLWEADIKHSPLDVVAWHGNFAPYKYDLRKFNTINTVSYDHPDPSIFTVLTSPGPAPGVANIDFAIFPDRWMVAEDSFRPPYFHRNIMNEYMGLIYGSYDAKEEGFAPGGASLHNCMSAHGPDADAFEKATHAELKPQRYHGTLAFMFESCFNWRVSKNAYNAKFRQANYQQCWQGLESHFNPNQR